MEQLIFKGMETEEGRNAAVLHNSIMAAKLAATNAMLDLCRGLKMMRDSKAYKALGFESFEQYSVNAVGIKYRMAANYIAVYEQLGEKMIAENADVGVTKLNLLAQISDPEERAEAAKEDLAGMTVAEVKALVAEKNSLQEQLSLLENEKANTQEKLMHQVEENDRLAEELNSKAATVEATVIPADIEKIKAEARAEGAAQAQKEAVKKAKEKEKKLRDKMDAQRIEAVNAARKQAAEEARESARREAEEKLAGELEAARAAEAAAKARAEEVLKKLEVQSDAETVKFGLYMEQLQQAVNGMAEQIEALRNTGKMEQAEKLGGAMKKILQIKLGEMEGA